MMSGSTQDMSRDGGGSSVPLLSFSNISVVLGNAKAWLPIAVAQATARSDCTLMLFLEVGTGVPFQKRIVRQSSQHLKN